MINAEPGMIASVNDKPRSREPKPKTQSDHEVLMLMMVGQTILDARMAGDGLLADLLYRACDVKICKELKRHPQSLGIGYVTFELEEPEENLHTLRLGMNLLTRDEFTEVYGHIQSLAQDGTLGEDTLSVLFYSSR